MLFTTTNPIDRHTHLIGGLGHGAEPWPLPAIYNAAFAALGLNWHYVPLAVPEGHLSEALLGLRALGFAGAEVTESHCCDVDRHLEDLSPAAEATGMINFIQVDEHGRLVGDNTQWRSFLWELHAMVPSLNGLKPLVIGAGPAARGIVYALAREGLPVTIVNPDVDQAIDLVRRLRHALAEHSFRRRGDVARRQRFSLARRPALSVHCAGLRPGLPSWQDAVFAAGAGGRSQNRERIPVAGVRGGVGVRTMDGAPAAHRADVPDSPRDASGDGAGRRALPAGDLCPP